MYTKDTPHNHKIQHASLEKTYIVEYLKSKGVSMGSLKRLPKEQARRLMTEACSYASLRLAEVESRAQFIRKIEFNR